MRLVFILFCCMAAYVDGQLATCKSSTKCVLLTDCPELFSLVTSRNKDGLAKVQKAICDYQGRRSMVCCPQSSSSGGTTQSPFTITTPKSGAPSRAEKRKLLPQDSCGRPSTDDKIFGGEQAPIGAYPWIVALGYTLPGNSTVRFDCGGSVINSRYILTAAHCVSDKYLEGRKLTKIHLGDHDLTSERDCEVIPGLKIPKCAPPHLVVGFEQVIMHDKFDTRARVSDDIALIRMERSIDFRTVNSYIAPVCLPLSKLSARSITNGRDAIAAGWGFIENYTQSNILLRVSLPLLDKSVCTARYGDNLVSEQLCVGGVEGKDTCSGDSGGPLVVSGTLGPPYQQIGIVSYGPVKCGQDIPAIYTSVPDYIDWILDNIEP